MLRRKSATHHTARRYWRDIHIFVSAIVIQELLRAFRKGRYLPFVQLVWDFVERKKALTLRLAQIQRAFEILQRWTCVSR